MPAEINSLDITGADYSKALDTLDSIDHFSIKLGKGDGDSAKVLFKRAGWRDRIRAFFLSVPDRAALAENVCKLLNEKFKFGANDHFVLQNIRANLNKYGLISGKLLAENLRAWKTDCSIDASGRLVAPNDGLRVGLTRASPRNVSANCQIVSLEEGAESAALDIPTYVNSHDQYEVGAKHYAEQNFNDLRFGEKHRAADKLFYNDRFNTFVMAPDEMFREKGINTAEAFMSQLGKEANGSVVLSPLPDSFFSHHAGRGDHESRQQFSDDHLRAQLRAAHLLNLEKFMEGRSLVITFATEHPELYDVLVKLKKELEPKFSEDRDLARKSKSPALTQQQPPG